MSADDTRNLPYRPLRIADLDTDDRPREKALQQGVKALSNAELIAIILGGGIQGLSVVDLSKLMLHDSDNSLAAIAGMTVAEMTSTYKGIGPAKAISLAAAFELGIRCRDEMTRADQDFSVIKSAADVFELFRHETELSEVEEFWALMLARNNRVKTRVLISRGGTAATYVDVKVLLKRAINCLAEGMILVHNHPSGNLKPSAEDDRLTTRIKEGAEYLGIKVLDHIIINRSGHYSYRDNAHIL